jgi:hypothetical protein
MNPWSLERKIIYLSIALVVLFVAIAIPLFHFFKQNPTCFDGKENGDETGIDCGGSCQLLCSSDRLEPVVLWSRQFNVTESIYSVVAYVQNPNVSTDALARYSFKLFDTDNIVVAERQGVTVVPKNKIFAVFEPNFDTQGKVPVRVVFEFDGTFNWRKNLAPEPGIIVTQKSFTEQTLVGAGVVGGPRVVAEVENSTTEDLEQIELVAIVYNSAGNAVGASRTFIDRISAGQSTQVTFTWPKPFPEPGSVVEVIPRIIPSQW